MTIGRNLITSLQLDVKGSNLTIQWDDAATPWRSINSAVEDICLVEDCQSHQPTEQEMQRMTDILDAKHKKANLDKIATSPIISQTVNKSHCSNF